MQGEVTDQGTRDECDFCIRDHVHIKRRYQGLRYCATCYTREFKPRACPGCGRSARLPVDRADAVCRACERRAPCTRCAKIDERRGTTTAEGRLCNACAQRLRETEPCELCTTASNRLSRYSRLGHDLRVCPRCARAGQGTCAACGRHRPLETGPDGRQLCQRCRDEGEHPCETCGQTTPAGYGRRCRNCEATERARKRIETIAASLEPTPIAQRFAAFGDWLIETAGAEKAARDAARHAAFFEAIRETWGDVPDYAALVANFSAEGLRRQRRPMRWLAEQGLVSIDADTREDDSEQRRIAATIKRLPEGSLAHAVMSNYCAALDERLRSGQLTWRSARLGLTPAVALLEAALGAGRDLPEQETLDGQLRETPGQRAALAGFVRWVRETHSVALKIAPRRAATALRQRRTKARGEMLALLRKGPGSEDFAVRWRTAGLAYFHDLALSAAREVREEHIQADRGGLQINVKNRGYWIPLPPSGGAQKVTKRHTEK